MLLTISKLHCILPFMETQLVLLPMDKNSRPARLLVFGLLAISLVSAGCRTGATNRDQEADEVLTRRRPTKFPAQPSPEPRPEFKQEPPSSQ